MNKIHVTQNNEWHNLFVTYIELLYLDYEDLIWAEINGKQKRYSLSELVTFEKFYLVRNQNDKVFEHISIMKKEYSMYVKKYNNVYFINDNELFEYISREQREITLKFLFQKFKTKVYIAGE